MSDDWLTTREIAALLNVTPAWIRRLISEGRLVGRKVGRDYIVLRSVFENFATIPRMKSGRPRKK